MEQFDELAQAQRGLMLTYQCLELFGRRGFDRRVDDGDLIKEHHGLYRVAGTPVTASLAIVGASLLYGAVGSVSAAGALHAFDRCPVLRPEVTVLDSFGIRKLKLFKRGVTMHRTNFLPDEHCMLSDGIPVTTPARTICDLSRRFEAATLGKILDDAVRRELVSYEAVSECRDELRVRGRRRITVLDQMLASRGFGFNPGESAPELKDRTWLEDAGLPPEVQVEVVVAGKNRRIDLAYVKEKVAVEYFGIAAHGTEPAVIEDSQRSTELQLAGWLIVFITKATTRREAVAMVREALEQRRGKRGL
jgi:hypothetical protein